MVPVETRSLKSSNPVLSRRVLGRHGGRKTAARDPLIELTVPSDPLPRRPQDPLRAYGGGPALAPPLVGDLLTTGAVLARTAAAFCLAALTAVLSWLVPPVDAANTGPSYGIAGGAALVSVVLVVVQCRARRPSPALTLAFAVSLGAFLGVLSDTVSTHVSPGVFVQVVLGTLAAFVGVLGAYALRWVRVTRPVYGFLAAGVLGLTVLTVADLLLAAGPGLTAFGFRHMLLGVFLGFSGVVLGTCFLALHFRQVEREIRRGLPGRQSWTVAFGLTLTLVWLYVETVRLLTLVQEDDVY